MSTTFWGRSRGPETHPFDRRGGIAPDYGAPGWVPSAADGLHQFQRRLKEKALPQMKLYDLRHGYATLELTNGASLREIMEQLGHTQISTTANIYTHVAPELRRKTAERMDKLFGT